MWANTGQRYWRIARSQILSITMANDWLSNLGYVDIHGMRLKHKAKLPMR